MLKKTALILTRLDRAYGSGCLWDTARSADNLTLSDEEIPVQQSATTLLESLDRNMLTKPSCLVYGRLHRAFRPDDLLSLYQAESPVF